MKWPFKTAIAIGAILAACLISFCVISFFGQVAEYANSGGRKARKAAKRKVDKPKKEGDVEALRQNIGEVLGQHQVAEQGRDEAQPNITTAPQLQLLRERQERERENAQREGRTEEEPRGEQGSVERQNDGRAEHRAGRPSIASQTSVKQIGAPQSGLSGSTQVPNAQDGEDNQVRRV